MNTERRIRTKAAADPCGFKCCRPFGSKRKSKKLSSRLLRRIAKEDIRRTLAESA